MIMWLKNALSIELHDSFKKLNSYALGYFFILYFTRSFFTFCFLNNRYSSKRV